ncbi:MAG: DUF1203 domain-containing protein [Pseudomonadota bacterium]
MDFQIHALAAEQFEPLFSLSDADLRAENAIRQTVQSKPGTPCRVSLKDAEVGETVILVNYIHQPKSSPYQASHAIFVREGAATAQPQVNEVPDVLASRLISVRAFNAEHMMIEADVMDGDQLPAALRVLFDKPQIAYVHLHNAKPGCFAAAVTRVGECV